MKLMKQNTKPVESFYDRLSSHYDEEQDAPNFAFVREPEKQLIIDYMQSQNLINADVLEIGAGTGRFTTLFAPKAKSYTVVDLSEQMLSVLSHKLKKLSINNVTIQKGNFLELDFESQFDYIISFSAIEYITNKQQLFSKISTLLKPGGKLYITTAHNTLIRFFGRLGNYFRQKIYMCAYRKKECVHLLQKNNLYPNSIEDYVLKIFPLKGILLEIKAEKKINEKSPTRFC